MGSWLFLISIKKASLLLIMPFTISDFLLVFWIPMSFKLRLENFNAHKKTVSTPILEISRFKLHTWSIDWLPGIHFSLLVSKSFESKEIVDLCQKHLANLNNKEDSESYFKKNDKEIYEFREKLYKRENILTPDIGDILFYWLDMSK